MHIFFAQRSTKKVKGVTDAGLKARKVRKVAVIGGGLMGSGIATAGLLAGQEVVIKEVNDKFLQVGSHPCLGLLLAIGFACLRAVLQSALQAHVQAHLGEELRGSQDFA